MIHVSIIIPTFNSEKYIKRCLDSLINQTLNDIEIIIVDDGSNDRTGEIIRKYISNDSRIRYFYKENEGQGVARNYGISVAQGTYVGFVDSDDYVELDMFERLYSAAQKYNADMAHCYMNVEEFREIPGATKKQGDCYVNRPEDIAYIWKTYFGGLPTEEYDNYFSLSTCTSIYSKRVIDEYGLRFETERSINSEDLLFNIDFLSHARCLTYCNQKLYNYCADNNNSFSLRQNKARVGMYRNLYKAMTKRSDKTTEMSLRIKRRFMANIRVTLSTISHWTTIENYIQQKQAVLDVVNDAFVEKVFRNYPIMKLPLMQAIYAYCIRYKLVRLLLWLPRLRYRQ